MWISYQVKSYILILPTTFLLNAFHATFSGLLNERIYDYGKTPVKDCVVLKIRERTSVDFAYPIKFYPIWWKKTTKGKRSKSIHTKSMLLTIKGHWNEDFVDTSK